TRRSSALRRAWSLELGLAALEPPHLHLKEAHASRPTGAERLETSLLRCEPGAQRQSAVGALPALLELRGGEDTLREAAAVIRERSRDPLGRHDVEPDAQDQPPLTRVMRNCPFGSRSNARGKILKAGADTHDAAR